MEQTNNIEKYILTPELLNKLAEVILNTLHKNFTTGYHEELGLGRWIDCNINFKYLSNFGGVYIEKLNIIFDDIEYFDEITLREINESCVITGYIPVDDRVWKKDKPFEWDHYTYGLYKKWLKKNNID